MLRRLCQALVSPTCKLPSTGHTWHCPALTGLGSEGRTLMPPHTPPYTVVSVFSSLCPESISLDSKFRHSPGLQSSPELGKRMQLANPSGRGRVQPNCPLGPWLVFPQPLPSPCSSPWGPRIDMGLAEGPPHPQQTARKEAEGNQAEIRGRGQVHWHCPHGGGSELGA